ALAGVSSARAQEWPVPFTTAPVLALRGQKVAVLTSGDPFWFGAGGSLARDLEPDAWRAFPGVSTFSLVAARLGWRLETTVCAGLHAVPVAGIRPSLQAGQRMVALVADARAAVDFAAYVADRGFGPSRLWLAEAMGGPAERLREFRAGDSLPDDIAAPVAVAVELAGGLGLPRSSGLNDDLFAHDGQITKRPVRALALSALAPRPGERLWDIGGGSGSVSVEWCLAGGLASTIEARADRAARIAENAAGFGVAQALTVIEGMAPGALAGLPMPDAVFVGGGGSAALLADLWARIPKGCRLVAHAVTLETESLLMDWQAHVGGEMMKVEIAHAAPLGRMRGWIPARPVLQWSVVR
ncbi:MAG: precorrin-6Y C5,15-methyltransferase (decarboxylating) subunit CbiT, partial [Pseudomonadota bacterium]